MAKRDLEAALRARLAKMAQSDPIFVMQALLLIEQSKADAHG